MTATGHAVIGTVIAAKIGNPALAVPLAIFSHLAADAIPHWDTATNSDKKTWREVFIHSFIDVVLSFVVSYIIITTLFPTTNIIYTFIMVLLAQGFDWLMAPYYFFNIKSFKLIYNFQKKFDHKLDKPWGIIVQVAIVTTLVILAKLI